MAGSVAMVTALLALAIIEGGLRWRVPASNVDLFEFTTATPRFKVMRPNVRGVVYGVPFETNGQGFRDVRSWSLAKGGREFRIAVLGDSVTVAAGVPFADIYTQVLQAELQRQLPSWTVNVLNLAVGGYDVVQYLHVLREVGLDLKPDYVVVGLFPTNDFDDTDRLANETVARTPALAGNAMRAPSWYESLYVYKAYGPKLVHFVRGLLPPGSAAGRATETGGPPARRRSGENWAALASLAETAGRTGVPLLVVLLPYATDFERQRGWHEPVKAFCAERGIAHFDLLEEFIKTGIPGRRFRLNALDDHANAAYNRVVGEGLAGYLARNLKDFEATVGDR